MQCSAVQCSAVSAVQCSALSAVQCSAVQCSTVQYSATLLTFWLCWSRQLTTRGTKSEMSASLEATPASVMTVCGLSSAAGRIFESSKRMGYKDGCKPPSWEPLDSSFSFSFPFSFSFSSFIRPSNRIQYNYYIPLHGMKE